VGLDNYEKMLLSYLKRTYEAKGASGGEGQPGAFLLDERHMKLMSKALRLFDLTLAFLFGLWSVHVFSGITGKDRYRCYNEPKPRLAKWEYGMAIGALIYAGVRLIQYIRNMFKKEESK